MKQPLILICILAAMMSGAAPALPVSALQLESSSLPPASAHQPPAAPLQVPSEAAIVLRAIDYAFSPSSIVVDSGTTVTVTLQNDDQFEDHDFAVRLPEEFKTQTCGGPCTRSVTFTAPVPGTYSFVCTVHSDMLGTLMVR